MEEPLIIGFLRQADVKRALEQAGELIAVASLDEVLAREFPRHPRLFVLEMLGSDVDEVRQIVQGLRRGRPLTDILIWAPQARGAAVRDLFRGGVKDVLVSHSVDKLSACVQETLQQQQFLPRVNDLSRQRNRSSRFESILSRSEAMWDLFDLCTRIAEADATVLIVGETGTGKELLARAVHRRSKRTGRFVAANCASLPPELITSELFGHEKGAFTGAERAKAGLVSHAHQGTLFLDEVGDMPAEAQLTLLRMLQEKRIRPVGSLAEKEVDVRVVAATNVPLDETVRAGHFREDLFYRLDVIRMNVPPLRERPEDILFLFGHFTKQQAKHYGLNLPTFSESFLDALSEYDWPGNVRQLENFSERLVLARPQRVLTARDFKKLSSTSLAVSGPSRKQTTANEVELKIDTSLPLQENLTPRLEQLEQRYLQAVLEQNQGRVAASAEQAGISRRTLLRKMNQYGLNKNQFKK